MFRPMRRSRQQLSKERAEQVLKSNTHGVLAVQGDDGYPYGVPLSYVYHNGAIYFHAAKSGHKLDAIQRDAKVSFTVVDEDTIVSQEYTSYFRSVIAFGKARLVTGEEERLEAFRALVKKYSGDQPKENQEREILGCTQAVIIGVDIEHLTGKEAIEYAVKPQEK